MTQALNSKPYDLEPRTLVFAKAVRAFVRQLPRSIATIEDSKQLVRSSGSVGANYREANDAISKKDFELRIRIARKEAKESLYWLELLDVPTVFEQERAHLAQEAKELTMILASIVQKMRSHV